MTSATPALGRVLLRGADIAERIRLIGETIRLDYAGKTLRLVVVGEGGRVFGRELEKAVRPEVDVRTSVLIASSYGRDTTSSGHVRLSGAERIDVAGSHVLLVDDIVDSGQTARVLLELLRDRGPKSLRFAALLSKEDRRVADVRVDYVGFEIPDEFVVGFGMDYGGAFRDLRDIRILET